MSLRFEDGQVGNGMVCPPFSWSPPFSLEVVVQPAAAQAPLAALVGNHPGADGRSGFVIHHDGDGVYSLNVGNRQGWRPLVRFRLEPERWSYLAVVAEQGKLRVSINGHPAALANLPEGTVHDSGWPLAIGNWQAKDRPFRGLIQEVRVLHKALTPAAIRDRSRAIRDALDPSPSAVGSLGGY